VPAELIEVLRCLNYIFICVFDIIFNEIQKKGEPFIGLSIS